MKKRYRLLGLILAGGLFLLVTGCGSLPPEEPQEAVSPEPWDEPRPEEPRGEPLPEPWAAPLAEPQAELIDPGVSPGERPLGALPEPVPPPLAEADLPVPSPAEEAPGEALPDPSAWTPPAPPPPEPEEEPVREPELPPFPLPPPPAPPALPERVAPAVESPPAVPPDPPEFLGPAEEPPPPPEPRRRPAVPVNPVPDLPARSSPEALQSPGEDDLSYSRTVRAVPGQLVEIPFRGTGWVYLGELEARRGIAYGSRRFDPEGQSFVFRAEEPGSYSLKFYKQDFIRDSVINDYVRVIVGESAGTGEIGPFNPPVDRGRVIAEPRWPPPSGTAAGSPVAAVPPDRAVPSAPAAPPVSAGEDPVPAPPLVPVATGPPAGGPGTAGSGETPSGGELRLGEELRADQYLSRAREEFDAGRVPAALGFLDQFREQYPSGSDEAWWLYGQFFEANSPSRDIRSALDYYRRLIREYPQSSRYNDARRRISYLERYYFNIP